MMMMITDKDIVYIVKLRQTCFPMFKPPFSLLQL